MCRFLTAGCGGLGAMLGKSTTKAEGREGRGRDVRTTDRLRLALGLLAGGRSVAMCVAPAHDYTASDNKIDG